MELKPELVYNCVINENYLKKCRLTIMNLNKTGRNYKREDSVIRIGNTSIGKGEFQIIAGPCSVESKEQILKISTSLKSMGIKILRGGAFKPRTSPYDFQGLKNEGIRLLSEAKKRTGLLIVSEAMGINELSLFDEIDIVQVGARNMQNFELLKALGRINKPILLKRGYANTIYELLQSAEYIMSEGNENIILCERGIRTFETATRNTLDLSIIPVIKELSHLPIIVDPSHATGKSDYVAPMAMAATAAGCDGLLIEVHNDPKSALSDAEQALDLQEFSQLYKDVNTIRNCINK